MSNRHSGNMLPTPLQQAGMEGAPFHSDTLELKEVTGAAILRLHSLAPAKKLAAELESHGVELPLQPNHSAGSDPAALSLRPNEWLLFSEQSSPESLWNRLRPAIDPAQTSLLNNSDGLASFRLSGQGGGLVAEQAQRAGLHSWIITRTTLRPHTHGPCRGRRTLSSARRWRFTIRIRPAV